MTLIGLSDSCCVYRAAKEYYGSAELTDVVIVMVTAQIRLGADAGSEVIEASANWRFPTLS